MIGAVDNAFTVKLVIGKLTVQSASAHIKDGVATIAFMTKPGFMQRFPRKVTVDGREMMATAARKSEEVRGVLLLTVDWVPEPEA